MARRALTMGVMAVLVTALGCEAETPAGSAGKRLPRLLATATTSFVPSGLATPSATPTPPPFAFAPVVATDGLVVHPGVPLGVDPTTWQRWGFVGATASTELVGFEAIRATGIAPGWNSAVAPVDANPVLVLGVDAARVRDLDGVMLQAVPGQRFTLAWLSEVSGQGVLTGGEGPAGTVFTSTSTAPEVFLTPHVQRVAQIALTFLNKPAGSAAVFRVQGLLAPR